MRFIIKEKNLASLKALVGLLRASGAKRLELALSQEAGDLPRFAELIHLLLPLLDYETEFEVWFKNFPYCVVPPASRDHIWVDQVGVKSAACENCLYQKICAGFPIGYFERYGETEVCSQPDIPHEVMFEIEPHCNFNCQFCFNKLSFAQSGRDLPRLELGVAKEIVKKIAEAGIGIIRFTGGEPLLYPDLRELIQYSKNLNLSVWLNTNGSLINKDNAPWLAASVENILIPIESYSFDRESEITGFKNSLEKKIQTIKLLKSAGIKTLRVGTVALPENIADFDKLKELVLSLPIDEWEFYNPVGGGLDKNQAEDLADKILAARLEHPQLISIANALSFCLIDDPQKLNLVCQGALFDDGHSRLVIDPRGFVKPHYFVNENLGDPRDILAAWQQPAMKARRNLENLAEKCLGCRFKYKCRGMRKIDIRKF